MYAVLRAVAEGKVRWAFWPPGTTLSNLGETGDGIWIRNNDGGVGDDKSEPSDCEEEETGQVRVSESDEDVSEGASLLDEEEMEGEELQETMIGGRFGALALEDSAAESTEEE